ncbi:MAG: hypothetical protein V4515_13195 [Chloroflexota bacterium]
MTPALSRRLGRALGTAVLPADDRWRIVDAAAKANTFADLPADIQRLVESLEPQT